MISKQADLFQGELPEVVKDLIWNDEDGFFENLLRWGGRGLFFAPAPYAIINVVAGMLGMGLSDVGRVFDSKLAGKDLSQIDLRSLASEIAEELYPKIEAKSSLLDGGIVHLAANPKPISFSSGDEAEAPPRKAKGPFEPAQPAQPVKKVVPAPVELSGGETLRPWAPEKEPPPGKKAPAVKPDPLGIERAKLQMREEFDAAKHRRRLEYSGLSFEQQLKLRELDAAEAASALERKKDLDRHHSEMEHNKFTRDRSSMEHQILTKNRIEAQFENERKKFDLQRELILGKITPEQHKLMMAALSGQNLSPDELERAKKSMTRAEREQLKKRLEVENQTNRQALKHKQEFAKQEIRNAKLMAAARRGDSALMSSFKSGVGKAGLVAAIFAILLAGVAHLTGGRGSGAPSSSSSSMNREVSGPRAQTPKAKTPAANKPPLSARQPGKKSVKLDKYIDSELNKILGD